MGIKTNLNMEQNTTTERLRNLSLNETTNPSLMEAQREERVLLSLPSTVNEMQPPPLRDLPFASTEEGIKNFDLAALSELNGTVTIKNMPIDYSGELRHNVTCVEITNQSDLERLMDMVGDHSSYNVNLDIARFELPKEARVPVSSVVGGTGCGFF